MEKTPKPQQILENIYLLPANKPSCNSYLLTGEKNTIIDPGTRESKTHLSKLLNQLNLDFDDIHDLIYTHCHYDHTGAGDFFLNATVYSSPLCHIKLLHQDEKAIHALKYQRDLPSNIPDKTLNHLDEYKQGKYTWTILHTLGHSDDSICLLEKNYKILISGDTVFASGIPALITDSGSDGSLIYSIEQLQNYSIDMILPGHGRIDNKPKEGLDKTLLNIKKRIQKQNKKILTEAILCSSQRYS